MFRRRRRRRRLLAGGLSVALVVGAVGGIYYYEQTRPVEKRGSSKVEFDKSDTPKPKRKPPKLGVAWPTYGYDLQRTKVSPYSHGPPFRRTWRLDGLDTLEFPPTVGYGNVYIAQQKGIFFARKAKTGKKLFTKRFKRCAASSPTLSKGMIYQAYMDFVPCPQGAANPTGFLTAMNARTGREKWRFKAKPIESTPLLHGGILYVGSWDNNVYAVRARDGKKLWSHQTDGRVNTSAAYSKGRIFIATDGGSVYALSAKTGRLAWRAQSQARFGSREFFYAAPTVAYGRVFIGNTDGTMYAFGQKTGNTLWARPLGTYIYSAAAVFGQKVFVGTYDGKLYALDAATGDTKWSRDMPSAVHAGPTVMGGLVYASTCSSCGSAAARPVKTGTDSTSAFDVRNGHKVWSTAAGKYANPIVADRDRTYLVGRSFLYALENSGSRTPAARRERRGARAAKAAAAR
ncbi:MAG: PQQ-binding-like beta-propeller repeat protein [Thermoleophilaceae bacterium]